MSTPYHQISVRLTPDQFHLLRLAVEQVHGDEIPRTREGFARQAILDRAQAVLTEAEASGRYVPAAEKGHPNG